MSSCLSATSCCFPPHFWSADPNGPTSVWREAALKQDESDAPNDRWKFVVIKGHDEQVGREESHKRVLDIATGDLYLYEPACSIRIKCSLIAAGASFYAAGMATVQFVKVAVDVMLLALDVIRALSQCSLENVKAAFVRHWEKDLGSDLFALVASPLYWLGMELGALVGLISPFDGRKIVTYSESSWHRTKDFTRDGRFAAYVERRHYTLMDLYNGKVCFFALCFTVRGNMNEQYEGKPKYTFEDVADISSCC